MAVACAQIAGVREIGGSLFTEAELVAADLLVQLSGSAGDEVASASDSGSPRSVNTGAGASAAWGKKEREAMVGFELDRRARKRYRLVSELYHATRRVDGAGQGSARKRKRDHQPEAEM
ncbi:hypothetical protein HU200_033931 [Digitaria exilis]|uniref:Uncharacterized protein n=1 Tax=Digitaria exilis TaxID=1010633 RepID=A0A835EKE1_9POAL|nr:hypothetical protein HU200_033931 [Digitaria exilis]